ncbi:MAG: hypothetical protein JWP17_2248 [Solirubrobacterales bacterium]|jgi:hypothetical protein|nr:hypothetical protein [Solirubrobacterales bacterium]
MISPMEELTIDQAREIARLRRRYADGQMVLHHRPHDLIVEVQRHGHAVALTRFAEDGSVGGELPVVALAA